MIWTAAPAMPPAAGSATPASGIDHLQLSPQGADRLRDAGLDKDYRGREKTSGHAPARVEIES